MASVSRLGRQIEEVIAALNALDARFALIGGLALASHKVIRATRDVDLLTDADLADGIHSALTAWGTPAHTAVPRQPIIFAAMRGLIFCSPAGRLLADAAEHRTAFGVLRVISTEGLIGFQKSTSGSEAPLAAAGGVTVPISSEREPYEVLDDLMSVVEALCPRWPPRGIFRGTGKFLL